MSGLDRLAEQYKDRPRIEALVTTVVTQTTAFLAAAAQMATLRFLATATGAQLDIIGKIIGQAREDSADDAEYKLRLTARIRANRSSGTIEELYSVFGLLLEGAQTMALEPQTIATVVLRIAGAALEHVTLFSRFLASARAGGVRGILEYLSAIPSGSFVMGSSAGGDPEGLGFDDSSDPGDGGAFAGATEG